MSRQKTQSQVTHTQVKNTRRKPATALKKKKMRTTCQSKIQIRYLLMFRLSCREINISSICKLHLNLGDKGIVLNRDGCVPNS